MIRKFVRPIAAAIILLFAALVGHAGAIPFYYDVDSAFLPSGPIVLENQTASDLTSTMSGFQVTLSGDAYNSSGQMYSDVLFLNQFDFSTPSNTAFTYNSGVWTAVDGDTLQVDSPSGSLSMMDTDALQSFTQGSSTATLAPTDSPPYIFIGDIDPGQSVPFSFTVDMSTEDPFNLFGSFVSTTPVPEPSTLVLAGLGAIGLFVAARRRRASK